MTRAAERCAAAALLLILTTGCRQVLGIHEPVESDRSGEVVLWTLSTDVAAMATLKNVSAQTATLEGLRVRFDDHNDSPEEFSDCEVPLPAINLPSGGSVRVHEAPLQGDVAALTSCNELDLNPRKGGNVLLCEENCSAARTIDLVSYRGSQVVLEDPPALASGVSFLDPLPAIGASDSGSIRYQRFAREGVGPAFLGSDWVLEPRTLFADFEQVLTTPVEGEPATWTTSTDEPEDVAVSAGVAYSNGASLRIEHAGEDVSTIVSHDLTDIATPRAISYVAQVDSEASSAGFFELVSGGEPVATLGFEATGLGARLEDGERVETPFSTDTWYHVELRDIDWEAKVFDLYVDRALVRAGVPFRSDASSVDEVRLYSETGESTAYYDAIEFWGP